MNGISVVIPTYRREEPLLRTIEQIRTGDTPAGEIVVVDQTRDHSSLVEATLIRLDDEDAIRWVRMSKPSIPRAMNTGLIHARFSIILFLDDDVALRGDLVGQHLEAHSHGHRVVAGQVLQPGEQPVDCPTRFRFNSTRSQWIENLMAGNFSIRREIAWAVGGFDENFIGAAFRFETEFAERLRAQGERIRFEPGASVDHLRVESGGTRSFGDHLRTVRPGHAVGAYYYQFRTHTGGPILAGIVKRLTGSIRSRHHLRRPWWIPLTLLAELQGLVVAGLLCLRGPKFANVPNCGDEAV